MNDSSEITRGRARDSFLVRLSAGLAGLQVVWTVILSKGTPYLNSLGLSKSATALIWMAGPVAGTIIQPIMGSLSDRCSLSWGKRRPFIIAGAIGVSISLIALAFVENFIQEILDSLADATTKKTISHAMAIALICCIHISIQPVQVGMRSLIVEMIPARQQAQATAWTTCLIGFGNIFGFFLGSIDIATFLGIKSVSEFQALAIISSIALLTTTTISCVAGDETSERAARDATPKPKPKTLFNALSTLEQLPYSILRVYKIQFFAWIAWFPMLYYKSTLISELYIASKTSGISVSPTLGMPQLRAEASRIGTLADLGFAIVALAANLLFLVMFSRPRSSPSLGLPQSRFTSLGRTWLVGHIIFIAAVMSSSFATNVMQACFLLSFVGLSWAITQWLPYVILGEEIAKQMGLQDEETKSDSPLGAGTIISLHNSSISLPQILSAAMCSGVFELMTKLEKADATAWALRVSTFGAVVAAILTFCDM